MQFLAPLAFLSDIYVPTLRPPPLSTHFKNLPVRSSQPPKPPQQHKYVGIAKDPSLYAPKNLGPKKRFPITFVKTIVPLKKITYPPSSSSSSPTFDYAFDRKSAIGKAAIARKKNSKLSTDDDPPPIDSLQNGIDSPPPADITASGPPPPFAPTLAWDPNSGPGMHVGSRIWAIDEQGTKDNLKHGRGFGRKEDKKVRQSEERSDELTTLAMEQKPCELALSYKTRLFRNYRYNPRPLS